MCAASFRANKMITLRLGRRPGRCTRRHRLRRHHRANITGTGMLAKGGAGTLALSGATTNSGATMVADGVLAISDDANLGAAGRAVDNIMRPQLIAPGHITGHVGQSCNLDEQPCLRIRYNKGPRRLTV